MLQRLLLKLGVIFLAGALGSGAALAADEATTGAQSPGLSAEQNSNNTLEINASGNGNIDVSSNSSQSQTIGGASDSGSGASTGSPAASQSLVGASDALSGGGTSDFLLAKSGVSQPTGSEASAAQPGQVASPVASASEKGSQTQQRIMTAWSALKALNRGPAALQSSVPMGLAVATAASPDMPNGPQDPAALLSNLRVLLTSSLIPAPQLLADVAAIFTTSLAVAQIQLVILVILLVAASLLLLNFYLARLRRSGYTDAARSDAGAAILFFVTPPKMSCTSVLVT